jgi:hypothetical protein
MKRLLIALLILAMGTGPAAAQVVLDTSGAAPGRYYFQVTIAAGGAATVSALPAVPLVKPSPGPTPPVPVPDDELSERALRIKAIAEGVSGDPERAGTAVALAAVYRELALKISDGTIKGREAGAFAVKHASDLLLTSRKVKSQWASARAAISDEWAKLTQENAAAGEYVKLLNEAAMALEASAGDAQPQLDWAMILEIIKLVIELLERFFPNASIAGGFGP